jgi:hypothetical protein
MGPPADPVSLRKTVYALLIALATGAAAGRILGASLVYDPHAIKDPAKWPAARPLPTIMCSSNDRSRWATVRALVDEGTYSIGVRDPKTPGGVNEYGDRGIIFEPGWTPCVDKVLNPETQRFYSSKPPLLATMVAGEYWLMKHTLGWSFAQTPESVIRLALFTVNLVPFVIYLLLLSRLVDRFGQTDWGRIYVVAAGCLGTLVLPFLSTFNNHTPATAAALAALYVVVEIWTNPERVCPGWFALAGVLAGFTVTLELPAAALAACLLLPLFLRSPVQTLFVFLPAAALPIAALFLTNYLAVGQLNLVYSKLETPWYQYEGSHWLLKPGEVRTGIDFLKESKLSYAFNLLIGHHGLFSLTPIFCLAIIGMVIGLGHGVKLTPPASDSESPERNDSMPQWLHALAALLTLVLLGFYVVKTNNYGGGTCGPRWLMWLTPFLLLAMLPAVDRLSTTRWGRGLGYVLLALSVVSAVYPMQNPWRHPWIWNWWESQGWLPY